MQARPTNKVERTDTEAHGEVPQPPTPEDSLSREQAALTTGASSIESPSFAPAETRASPEVLTCDPSANPLRDTDPTAANGPPPIASTDHDQLGMRLSPSLHAIVVKNDNDGSTIAWPPESVSGASEPLACQSRTGWIGLFGKYELIGEIGRGGMGVVYKARQNDLDRLVAVKMILASHLANSDQIDRFYAEARAAAQVRDPNIVAIHDVGEIRGQHYFAMEFVEGPSLAQLIRSGPLSPREAGQIVATVARAVHRLHQRGIVHRDLKPSNILLDKEGRPYVTDFGLAKVLQAEHAITHSGAIVGTPSYMAPEQAASGRAAEVGPLSDIYSLGAILYELLTGQPPFDEPSPLDTLVQVLEAEPQRPSRLNPHVPKPLELICLKCLEKDSKGRFVSAEALAEDLERYLKGDPVEARRLGLWQRVGRWARREPALAARLSILAIGGAILQADQYLLDDLEPSLNRRILTVLILGAFASVTFQILTKYLRRPNVVRYSWTAADMILFTTLVEFHNGLKTSLVAGYFLLIAASGLWFREALVWFTTSLAVLSYIALIIDAAVRQNSPQPLHRHALFVAVIGLFGLIVAYQVKRVRALSHYYEKRPLP